MSAATLSKETYILEKETYILTKEPNILRPTKRYIPDNNLCRNERDNAMKRDLYSHKRDLYSHKRDLYSHKRDLYSHKRDLYPTSYQRNLENNPRRNDTATCSKETYLPSKEPYVLRPTKRIVYT